MQLTVPPSNRHGVIFRPEVLALGGDDKAIRRMLGSGHWTKLRRGAYMETNLWAERSERELHLALAFAVISVARCFGVRSHATAARVLDVPVWDLPDDVVDLTRFDGKAGRAEAGVRQHKGWLGAQDVTRVDREWTTTGTRTALDITTVTDLEHSLVVVDGLLHAGHTTPELLAQGLERMTFCPNSLGTGLVLRLADGRSESVGESRTRLACWRQGLPPPEPQYEIWTQGRLLGRLDLAWPELGVWIEFDGKEKYVKYLKPGESVVDAVVREKKREDAIRRVTGWVCIRITWADLYHPERIAEQVRQAFHNVGRSA